MNSKYGLIAKVLMWVFLALGICSWLWLVYNSSKYDESTQAGIEQVIKLNADNPDEVGTYVVTGTNLFVVLMYILIAVAAIVTLASGCSSLAARFSTDPKGAIFSLLPWILLCILLLITWFMGSGEKMDIIGYEGTDNQGFWAQATDAIIYSSVALIIIAGLSALCGWIYSKVSK